MSSESRGVGGTDNLILAPECRGDMTGRDELNALLFQEVAQARQRIKCGPTDFTERRDEMLESRQPLKIGKQLRFIGFDEIGLLEQ